MTYKNKRHLPWLLFDTLLSIIFFITLITFGNDLVYVLVFFLFLCCSWNMGWLGDCYLFVCCFISSSYDSTRLLSDAQHVFVEWMSRWIDKYINGTLFSQSHHPQAPWWFLTHASSCSAESSHSLPCLWTLSLHPYLLSPPLCIYTWTLSDNSKLLEDRRSPSFPQRGQHRAWVITVPTGPVFTVVQMLFTWSWYTSGRFRLRPQPSTLNHMLIWFFWFMHDLWWVNEWVSEQISARSAQEQL